MRGLVCAAIAAACLSACVSRNETGPAETQSETPDALKLARQVEIQDDPAYMSVLASTLAVGGTGYVPGEGYQDVFLSASRSRIDDDVVVSLMFRTQAPQWVFAREVKLGETARSHAVKRIRSDVSCSSAGCEHAETVMTVLSEEDIRDILASDGPIPLRFVTERGQIEMELWPAELEALLLRLDIIDVYLSPAPSLASALEE